MPIPSTVIEELIRTNSEHRCPVRSGIVRSNRRGCGPTDEFGPFQIVAFHSPGDQKDHAALIRGNPVDQDGVAVRLHSECLTGDTFASLRCDCREQLEIALHEIGRQDAGIILYLRQEGRGIGFANKIRAYQLQQEGYDTIQANERLGFLPDERDYAIAAHMLYSLRVQSIRLMSNNPDKVADLQFHGVKIDERIPIIVPPNPFNQRYLETKRLKAGHLLGKPLVSEVPEQVDSADTIPPTTETR